MPGVRGASQFTDFAHLCLAGGFAKARFGIFPTPYTYVLITSTYNYIHVDLQRVTRSHPDVNPISNRDFVGSSLAPTPHSNTRAEANNSMASECAWHLHRAARKTYTTQRQSQTHNETEILRNIYIARYMFRTYIAPTTDSVQLLGGVVNIIVRPGCLLV